MRRVCGSRRTPLEKGPQKEVYNVDEQTGLIAADG